MTNFLIAAGAFCLTVIAGLIAILLGASFWWLICRLVGWDDWVESEEQIKSGWKPRGGL